MTISNKVMADWDQRQKYFARLDEIQRRCNEYSETENYDDWYDGLESIYREIIGALTTDEEKKAVKLMVVAEKWAKMSGPYKDKIDRRLVRKHLNELHTHLSRCMWDHGLVIPKQGKTGGEEHAFLYK